MGADKKNGQKSPTAKLVIMARKHWRTIGLASVGIVGAALLNLITPAVVRSLTRQMTEESLSENLLLIYAAVLAGAYLLRAGCRWVALAVSHVAAWNFVGELTAKVYEKLQRLSMRYYQDKQTGQLMSRMINDTRQAEVLIAHALPDLISNLIVILGVAVLIFTISPVLAAITLIPVPVVFWAGTFFSKKVAPLFRINQEVLGDINAVSQDNLSGMKEIQAFGQEERELEKMLALCRHYSDVNIRANFANALFHPGIEFLTSLGTVIVVGIGGYLAMRGEMSVADVVGFLMYLGIFYQPLAVLSRLFEDVQVSYAGAARIFEILDTESDVREKPDAVPLESCGGKIEFRGVSFHYNDGEPVLSNISFTANPGEMIAVVGPTGVGKTTVVSLLERFYDPQGGSVLIDDTDIRDVTIASLRAQISMVLQDVFLFNGTIAENIAYSVKDAAREQVERAAQIACADDFIRQMPDGYDTVIGERGVRLSGGQKQRLSIARAVLRDTPILILDEATSSVDMETELQIQRAIENLAGSRTVIIIAHRLSTIISADRIIVLDKGAIIEKGSYEELMERDGIFARLNRSKRPDAYRPAGSGAV
ncbi:MAG: ABC transporter ATP-binding protein/permease [Oscillospiraceae bacterium]|nr:ABC transporter ATP-binding protein/permease [Oscillospiraceae bacterium]